MLLIFISWIYIFIITTIIGVSINKIIKINRVDSVVALFLGFFYITLFTSFWAVFFAVNWQFHIVLFALSSILLIKNRIDIRYFVVGLKDEFLSLSVFLKVLFLVISTLTLIKSASPPYLIDNEYYYIQTIKWINEYGFVKGLINLHPYFGQTSGWHILQSAFSFSFIYDNFNDINGIALIFGNLFAFDKLNRFYTDSNSLDEKYLIVGLFPLSNLFFFQFISSPSHDIPIYIIFFIIIYYFIELYKNYDADYFKILTLLLIFLVFVKVSSIPLIILSIVILIKYFNLIKTDLWTVILFGVITLIIFIIKNLIITGNAIYPLSSIDYLQTEWRVPVSQEIFFNEQTKVHAYLVSYSDYVKRTYLCLFKNWIMQPIVSGLFNKLMIFLLIVFPFFIHNSKNKNVFYFIYFVAIINMIFLFSTSPQYRFFYHFILILSIIIITTLTQKKKYLNILLTLSTTVTIIPIFFLSNLTKLSKGDLHLSNPVFKKEYLIEPHENTRFDKSYEIIEVGNLKINSPLNINYFWGVGDVDLPALNKYQLEFFKKNYNIIPQQRTDDLKDGFYSKELK